MKKSVFSLHKKISFLYSLLSFHSSGRGTFLKGGLSCQTFFADFIGNFVEIFFEYQEQENLGYPEARSSLEPLPEKVP